MTEPSQQPKTDTVAVSGNGAAAPAESRYCGYCGEALDHRAAAIERFGEPFCSDAHAQAFVTGVRAARVQAAVPLEAAQTGAGAGGQPTAAPAGWNLKRFAKLAACCGLPMLALVVLAGGAGALVGAAGAALPLLAALACPVGMFFAMRGMMRTPPREWPKGPGEEK
jgi:hypothetical protein